ncbi:class I SAM-dependent methyltransferase [Brumimicrobium oceani]|uniref:SAM-dependent methyltransferase n=1 Tax=Brumimicrobium oceani TaxID=2100725 RepID=A0A2U2XA86_9FLAO|nr:methyltransferase domain-containing protein [Brumimicrobium oceani]PWH84692.1 SAM-dependent methyltransferase [Brumimicrobium oceani]
MEVKDISTAPGHWILAKMGKKVLRPGGKELTEKLVENLKINKEDDVIEFAPGLGFTANLSLKRQPHSYIGVDADPEAISYLQNKIKGKNLSFVNGNAQEVNLKQCCATKLYGEAMLTMHADHRKANIIKEAHRLLKPGGLYAIHEIGLTPNTISEELKAEIQKDLATTIRVNARPLTIDEWTRLLVDAGFEVVYQGTNGMHLLESKRIVSDEGFFNSLKIGWNIMSNGPARKRILAMQKVFRKHESHMNAVVMVARKL